MRQTAMDEQLLSICHAEFGLRRATGRHSEVRHLEQMRADTCTLASTNTRTHIHATAVREISKQNVANTHTHTHAKTHRRMDMDTDANTRARCHESTRAPYKVPRQLCEKVVAHSLFRAWKTARFSGLTFKYTKVPRRILAPSPFGLKVVLCSEKCRPTTVQTFLGTEWSLWGSLVTSTIAN